MTAGNPDARHCIKCGREVEADDTMCEVCNRAGMATPSASQYHGTVVVAIVLAVVGLAAAASLSLRGVGPYAAELDSVAAADPAGYEITFTVANEGTRAGRAKCRLIALGASGERLGTRSLLTGPIDGGADLLVAETISGLQTEPTQVTVTCS